MLDLAPEIERTVRDTAAREGVSVNEVVARKFAPAQPAKSHGRAAPRQWRTPAVSGRAAPAMIIVTDSGILGSITNPKPKSPEVVAIKQWAVQMHVAGHTLFVDAAEWQTIKP